MGWNISNILVNEAIANKNAGGSDPELAGRVTALEADVSDLEAAGYTVADLESKTLSSTNYEDMTTFKLPAGLYQLIVGVYSEDSAKPVTGVKVMTTGNLELNKMENYRPCTIGSFFQTEETTYKVQVKGTGTPTVKGFYMIKKIADYVPPASNTRKGGKK